MSFNFVKEMELNTTGDGAFTFFRKGFLINGKLSPSYIDVILSGVSPLVLTNAIELNYLKLFGGTEQLPETYLDTVTLSGGCEQSGTPTPTQPSPIVCNNGVIKVSKNLFNSNQPTLNLASTNSGGGAYTLITNTERYGKYLKVKPNTTYTISRTDSFYLNLCETSVVPADNVTNYYTAMGTVLTYTITTQSTTQYLYIYGANSAISYNLQIEQGTTATTYMPYGQIYIDGTQEVVTDSLGNTASAERLLAVGDYKDTQEVLNGAVTRNVRIKVLDGTESDGSSTWQLATGTGYKQFYMATSAILPYVIPNVSLISNITPYGCTATTRTDYDFGCYSGSTGFLCFQMYGSSTINTVNDWKAYLATQYANGTPVIVVYPLETATTSTVTGQFLSKSPVTQTAGSISNLPIAITESQKTVPTPQQPLQINCNNGVVKVSKNLLNPADNNFVVGKIIDASGNITVGVNNFYTDYYIPVKPNTSYVATGRKSDNTISAYTRICWYDSSKTFISRGSYEQDTATVNISPANAAYARITCAPYNSLSDITLANIKEFNWVFQEGTTEPAYMPYGQIYVDGTVETVEITGKNLFNPSIFASSDSSTKYTHYQVPNGVYTMSSPDFPFANSISNVFFLAGNVSTGASSAGNGVAKDKPVTITVTDGYYTVAHRTTSANQNLPRDYNWQIEQGPTATTYEPYTLLGTATAEKLFKIGTYQDVQSVIDGEVTRNVGVKVLDGTENWALVDGTANVYRGGIPNMSYGSLALCTHYSSVSSSIAAVNMPNNTVKLHNTIGGILYIKDTSKATAQDFTDYLANQYANGTPVILLCPLATPTTETVTAQPMNIQAGTNIVEITQASIDNLTMEISYKQSN